MFFIYSKDQYLISKQIDKLVKKINVDNDYEIFNYSLIDDSIIEIISQINTYSLFSRKKIIIINDSFFVNENKPQLHKDYDNKYIEKIINNKNPNVDIIFTVKSEKISKKLKIAKLIENNAKTLKVDIPNFDQKYDLVVKKLEKEGLNYNKEAIIYFLDRVIDDVSILVNEVNKLISLNKDITKEVIEDNVFKYYQYNIFELAESFIKNDIKAFLKGWNVYIELNSNMFSFLALLSSQFCLLRNALLLKKMNKNISQISSILNQNPYRVQKLMSENRLDINKINDTIKTLYKLEKNLKNGEIDNKIIPELEFIKLFKREVI
ncbi:DNA polymerase III subunit delta [Spiroplasma tabanidicola]|uniref:DNA polymerase III subunit delta n=1 Tax=Spiroplasma tabanidicola TaxID=324079 RepID=A0A6I6CCF8_9MOLU|nr:DNA polymerase III subunit delta [Spiroplasma tabanidicola]QGS51958.1 DNA polymerase III subunit delta [Spiroplasma tabanidicola]